MVLRDCKALFDLAALQRTSIASFDRLLYHCLYLYLSHPPRVDAIACYMPVYTMALLDTWNHINFNPLFYSFLFPIRFPVYFNYSHVPH